MSKRKPAPVRAPQRRDDPKRLPWRSLSIAGVVVMLVGASFVVPRLFEDGRNGEHHAVVGPGDGPGLGTRISYSERDVVTGRTLSSETARGRKTLLFFSEGVMCQACFEQIRDIEDVGTELEKRGIDLVSITPDPQNVLKEAIGQYGISTSMISDEDHDMSAAFDTLGRGMHPDTPGHAFVLLDKTGKVVWQRDYWLAPYRTMYVEPSRLIEDLTAVTQES